MNHFNISLFKSILRIIAGVCLVITPLSFSVIPVISAGVLFILAECLGILEELV